MFLSHSLTAHALWKDREYNNEMVRIRFLHLWVCDKYNVENDSEAKK